MDTEDEKIRHAVENTEILRPPKQSLSTFGTTNIYYYLVTEPAYTDLTGDVSETVVREGRVITEQPRIVTPYYLSQLEGFSLEARRYFDMLINTYGRNAPGLFYTYRNEPKGLNIVSDSINSVVERINAEIDRGENPLATIIKGQDDLWDVSLMKFIYELTRNSVGHNLSQMENRGLLGVDTAGVPFDARKRIEQLFERVSRGESKPGELKDEMERWGLFEEYQDRFLALFKKKR